MTTTRPPTNESSLPPGWVCSTELDQHISYYHRGTRYSVVLIEKPGRQGKWTVRCLAGYRPERPRLADGVSLETAYAIAAAEMEAIHRLGDETALAIEYASPEESDSGGSDIADRTTAGLPGEAHPPADDGADNQVESESDETQASIDQWT